MKLLKDKIIAEAQIIDDRIIKVDNFLNHQIDVQLINEIGKEFKRRFASEEVTKILTVEASGIGIACITAQYFNAPVVFAKKHEASNVDGEVYQSQVYSYTKDKYFKIRVAKRFISSQDKVLIIDDFLANGNALGGLIEIVEAAGAKTVGVGIVIEKSFQQGRQNLTDKKIRIESLAIIDSLENGTIHFR